MREVCVRDAVMSADAGSDALASDAAVAQDAWVDQCALGSVAAASSVTLAQLLGGTATQPIEPIANLEITPDGSGPIAIPFNEPFALALEGQRAWIASSTSTGTGRSADRLLWDVDNIFGAGLVVTDIATDFVAINDVSAADTRLGQDGLSALFVRLNPDVRMPALFYRLTDNGPGIAPLSISISDTTDAIFPSDAVLFGGFQASGDDSAIALTIQGIDGVNTATQLFLIPGTAPTDSGRTLELGGVWPTPLPLVGTQGALAALNRTTGRVQVLRLDENGTFPTRWTWGEDMRASHMAFTNVPARENEFLIASMNGCSHVLITRIECASSSGCTELGRIRVLARSYTNELHITPVGSGFALVTREDNIEITWLDASLRIVAPPSAFPTPLFTFNPAAFPTFNFERISIAANSDGFMAVALFRDGKTARYFRRGVRLAP